MNICPYPVEMTQHTKHQTRFVFYLVLSVVGLITAWVFNGIASVMGANYLLAWFGTPVDWVLSLDLLIVAVAGSAFMIFEAKKLGMKRVWVYIALSGITAFAFTFPLFLALRERKLAGALPLEGS
jgi:uncharacterized membrane protein